MPRFALILACLTLLRVPVHCDDKDPESRARAIGAFSRGEALSWDQLEVVAQEAGVSRDQIIEMKIKDRANRLIQQNRLPLEVAGFSNGMDPGEEFRLFKGSRPGKAALLFNSAFWEKNQETCDNDPYMSYLLFRAEAYFTYRSHYDSEHGAWIVQENSPSFQILKTALDGSESSWVLDDGPPTGRDLEFRRTVERSGDPARTIRALVDMALRAVAQKAADDWASMRYRQQWISSPFVTDRIHRRERALAADFNQARSAMTRAERVTFQNLLRSPFRYARQTGVAASEPTFDPAVTTSTSSR